MTKIKENQWIILKRGDILKTVQVIKKKKHNFEKLQFTLDAIIGQEFETAWRLEKKGRNNGILMPLDFIPETESYTLKPGELDQAVRDNRSIDDKSQGNNQITDEQVLKMKKEVSEGKLTYQEMMNTIKAAAANTTTKTDYSLKKYETRKEQKHLKYFVVQKPTPRLVTKCYEGRNTGQICYLTNEAMAFMVNQLNVQKNTTIGVVETTSGMCLANILNRGADVLNFFDGSATATHCVDIMNYENEFLEESLLPFPLDKVGTLLNQKTSYEDYFRIPFDPETDKPYVLEEIEEINKVSERSTRRGKQSAKILDLSEISYHVAVLRFMTQTIARRYFLYKSSKYLLIRLFCYALLSHTQNSLSMLVHSFQAYWLFTLLVFFFGLSRIFSDLNIK